MAQQVQKAGGPLTRWARFASRHPWRVLGGWVVGLAILATVAVTAGGSFVDSFKIPGTESQAAVDLLQSRFPSQAGDSAQVVFQAPAGVTDPAVQAQIQGFLASAATLPEVLGVASPFDTPGTISADGTIAYATLQYDKAGNEVADSSVDALNALVDQTATNGLVVEAGGQVITSKELPETGSSELIGIGAAIVILLITFGSIVAMGLPIITALVGLAIGILGATVVAAFIDMSTITTAFISMMGLGVGIDYALFVVTRFREGRGAGLSVQNAVVTAVDTAGRAVLFAGSIVIIALLGLFTVGIPFVGLLGLAAAIVVAGSMLVATALMPALLSLLGTSIDRWTIPTAHRGPVETTLGYKLTSRIQRRPWAWLAGALVVILLVAVPVLDLQLGSSDAGNNPTSFGSRRTYDLLAEGFGPGFNGPLLFVVDQGDGGGTLQQTTIDTLAAAIGATANVVAVSPASFNPEKSTAVFQVIPGTSPQDRKTEDLIKTLRHDVIPAAVGGTGAEVYVGGGTATFADLGTKIGQRLPIFILVVAGLSIIVLMAVFRSIVIPLKAAILNLLSFLASFGVLVAVFQWGWLAGPLGVERKGPIESFVPMILFGILFGLSMDYEVFLVSRIRESYLESKNNRWALTHGIGVTGRVIIAAGSIMVCVFLAFVLGDARAIKEFGVGLASAIFIDVAIVRLIIVPSVMTLFGDANWWFPAWLDRILPKLDIEGSAAHHPAGVPVESGAAGVAGAAGAASNAD